MKDPLIWVRAIHFVATMMVMGGVIFRAFIGEPAFRAANSARLGARVRLPLAAMAWFGLAVTVLSGAAWLVLQAERMSELSLAEVFSQGAVWTVLSETDFGIDWGVRFALAGLLAAIWVRGDVLRPYYRRALVAAAAWFGSLIPLALLLRAARRLPEAGSVAAARQAVLRFSPLGVVSVGTLVATGVSRNACSS